MTSSRHPAREGSVDAPPGVRVATQRRRPPRWLIVVAAAVGAGVVGFLAALPFSRHRELSRSPELHSEDRPATAVLEGSFEGAAFSPKATVDDLNRETIRTIEGLLEAYPDTPDSLSVAARHQLVLGSSDTAVEMWRRCLELDPGFVDAYFGMGLAAKNRGDLAEAVQMFEKVITLAPTEPRAPSLLAETLMKLGRIEAAAAILDEHVHTQAASTEAVIHLGQAYLQLNEYEKARQTFEALLEADPGAVEAYWGLGRAYTKLGEKEKARHYLEKFRSLLSAEQRTLVQEVRAYVDVPTARGVLAQTLVECGQVHQEYGSLAEAERMWRKAAFMEPKDTPSRRNLMALYEEQDRDHDALKICEELSEIEPDDPGHWFNIGLLNGRLGRLESGLEAITKAIQLDPDNPSYRHAYDLMTGGK